MYKPMIVREIYQYPDGTREMLLDGRSIKVNPTVDEEHEFLLGRMDDNHAKAMYLTD